MTDGIDAYIVFLSLTAIFLLIASAALGIKAARDYLKDKADRKDVAL